MGGLGGRSPPNKENSMTRENPIARRLLQTHPSRGGGGGGGGGRPPPPDVEDVADVGAVADVGDVGAVADVGDVGPVVHVGDVGDAAHVGRAWHACAAPLA